MIKFRQDLSEQLTLVNEYLNSGTVTTIISYYDENGIYLGCKKVTSKWSTSNGKKRVETNHKWLIQYYSKNEMPGDTYGVNIKSPFVEIGENTFKVVIKVHRPINVSYNCI
jgi:hypothetical protein